MSAHPVRRAALIFSSSPATSSAWHRSNLQPEPALSLLSASRSVVLAYRRTVGRVTYVKRRLRPAPDSIPGLLNMFEREVRFYREIAPEVGIPVPALVRSTVDDEGIVIELEDLSSWVEGGDPVSIARVLRQLHDRWHAIADGRWPWLNRAGRAANEIGDLFDRVWSDASDRDDMTTTVRKLGDSLRGRVGELERAESSAGPRTLVHGDATSQNVRTSSTGVIALLDWEDVRTARGEVDLSWLLLSSVDPGTWDDVIAAYEPDHDALVESLPANAAQAIFGLSDHEPGSDAADGWIARLEAAARLLE